MSTQLVAIQEKLKQELAQLKNRVPEPSGMTISVKGRVFRFPDGTTSTGPIQAVILDWRLMNQYYSGVYNPAKIQPPDCWAISLTEEDMAPDERVKDPKAKTCEECVYNEWGSHSSGKGKACKNQRKLAIVAADATERTKPLLVTVTPTATKGFDSYIRSLTQEGRIPLQVVTSIGFDPNRDYPSLVFGRPVPVPESQWPTYWALREKAQQLLDQGPLTPE